MKWGKVYVNDEFESLQKWRYYRKLTPYEKFVVAQTQIFFQKMGQVPNVIKLTNLSRFVVG